eukprot:11232648-Prorocentrum_lima.AAC.1
MKNFVQLHGTSLKSVPKVGSKDLKVLMEAIATQEEDWSQCTKEQALTKLEALSRKKLVPYARTRFK